MLIKVDFDDEEFRQAVQKLIKSVKPDKIEPVLFKGATIVTRTAKKLVKKGPTGNLRKAVKTKQLKRIFNNPGTAISAIDRKRAPHAHLYHEGTGERIGKKGARAYIGRRFGKMQANPFMDTSFKREKNKILTYIEGEVKKLVEGAVR